MSKIAAMVSFNAKSEVELIAGRRELVASRKLVVRSKMVTIPSLLKYLFANEKIFTENVKPCNPLDILSNPRIDPKEACCALVKAGKTACERVLTAIQFKTTRGNRKAYDSISAYVNSVVGTDFDYMLLSKSDIDNDEDLRDAINALNE